MPDKPASMKLPPILLVLDLMGTAIVALGLFELYADPGWFPPALQFRHYPWVLIAIGVALMLPALVFLMRAAFRR